MIQIAFIDEGLQGYRSLAALVPPGIEVVILDARLDGLGLTIGGDYTDECTNGDYSDNGENSQRNYYFDEGKSFLH